MKHQILPYILSLAILLSLNVTHAQEKRYSFEEIVPGCQCPEFEQSAQGFELKPLDKFSDFEIRFYIHAKWYDQMVTTITRRNGKYVGFFYHKMRQDFRGPSAPSSNPYNYKKFQLDQANLDSVVQQLLVHKITTLPNQNEIYKKGFLTLYHISYIIDGQTRFFSFGPPADPIREHPNEPVYQHYDAIIKMFFKIINPLYDQIRNDISKDFKSDEEKERRDTIFLRKPNAEGHSVYVDKDRAESPYFDVLTNLDYTQSDKQYKRDIKTLQKYRKHAMKPINLGELPRNWVPLHVYKGNYYVYSPSNRIQRKVSFNDSTMIVNEMERSVYLLNDVLQKSKDMYQISTVDFKGQVRPFQIHLIHKSRGIAVFEDYFGNGSHMLMVTVERADRFPLITNYSPNHTEPEFVFDVPDFKELLRPERWK